MVREEERGSCAEEETGSAPGKPAADADSSIEAEHSQIPLAGEEDLGIVPTQTDNRRDCVVGGAGLVPEIIADELENLRGTDERHLEGLSKGHGVEKSREVDERND